MMGEIMQFPETVEEFMQQYKIADTRQVYTNGTELVPIFRMKQWFEAHKQRWIPCSDKLPEKDGQYLVAHAPTGWMGVRNFSLEKSFDEVSENFYRVRIHKHNVWWYMDDELYARVSTVITHWMPLPEPPEMDGGAENG